jgi:hypothetical protein
LIGRVAELIGILRANTPFSNGRLDSMPGLTECARDQDCDILITVKRRHQ